MGADLQSGASSVTIEGNPMAKKSSFLGKSTGNEVAQSTGGGVVSAVVQGKAYFTSYSIDVTVEGEEAPRHLDMLTHNHAGQSPPNAAMGTYLAMMDPAVIAPASEERPKRPEDKPQDIEFFLDHVQNKPTGGADSVILVSDDGAYNQTMSLSAASPKGGLLSLKFQKVLPSKGYSLYWKVGDHQITLFEHVAFADILDHTPGSEKPAAAPPPPEPDPPDPGRSLRGEPVEGPATRPPGRLVRPRALEANVMGDSGNFILSHGFQFTDTETAHAQFFDGEMLWTPALPKKFQLMKERWIYAYVFVKGQKGKLAGEYHADKDGALTFVPGDKRRGVEASKAPKGASVPEAALPVIVQADAVKYAFVATRGRMGKDAIRAMENSLHPIYTRVDLADPSNFHAGPNNQKFLPIIDILTVAEGLHWAYLVARNAAINYVMVHPFNTDNDKVEIQTLKYRLAKIIKEGLWQPPSGKDDPMDLAGYLSGNGNALIGFMSDYESGLNKLIWAGRNLALDLVRLLNSRLWIATCAWYLDTPEAAKTVGHFCLDVFFRCLDRLGETPEGQAFERQLVHDQDTGLLSFLFVPDEDAESDLFDLWFPVVRKATTAVVIGMSEMAPALVAYGKARTASMEKIVESIRAFLTKTSVTLVREAPRGDFVEILHSTHTSLRIEINFKEAKADLEGWLEEGKPGWPQGTRMSQASTLAARFLMCIELVNFYNSGSELLKEPNSRHIAEFAGALCDLAAALEDPIKGWAKTKEAQEAAGAELAGEVGADAEAGG